ncbi:MAG: Cell division protein FtsZ [Sphingomonas bacterium]|uniref:cell division protein FtsZ n=1 Tax=Sphingomonas bacterium TaxID=1895847 RepID=UPI0026299693|nr:cell division protein FtsZ [Sphingomonas bacterium]MDB5703935.1 Cell division protein FtsZ [Sphingomonas bacterium]
MMQQELNLGEAGGVTLFGVGGAGGNAVARLFRTAPSAMKVICANTDVQALRAAPAANQLQLGRRLTGGLGAGARPEIGRAAAEEALPEIIEALEGSALCFVAAGLGGGTGTGAAPVIAKAARERGILTIGIATRPFAFEGGRRGRIAAAGLAEFEQSVDAMVVVCNEHLFRVAGRDTTFRSALDLSDSIVCETATDFAALIAGSALKRVTLADIRATLQSGGRTVIGYGERIGGKDRAIRAADSALRNPLLEDAPRGAQRLLVTIAGGTDLRLFEVEETVDYLREKIHPGADLVWGSVIDPALDGRMRVGIAAAGLPARDAIAPSAARAAAKAAPAAVSSVQPISMPKPRPVPAAPALALTRVEVPVPAPAMSECATPPQDPLVDPQPMAAERAVDSKVLILTSSYSLDLDIVAERPLTTGPIRSRGGSASLVDRLYFATRDLKRSWRRPRAPVEQQAPRKITVTRGLSQLAAG